MSWKDLTRSQKFGWIIVLVYFFIGVYSAAYHVTLWSFYAAEWIVGKINKRRLKTIEVKKELYDEEV